jgi:ketosteroid isomerase-like protein
VLPTPEDQVAISALLASYSLTLDADDVDAWVALFTPDARYEVYGRSFDGHVGLRRMLSGAPGGLHLGGPPLIEMTAPDRARTTRNLLFVERGTGALRSAVYTDELHRTADGWRIAHCRCRFIVAAGLADRPDR